MVTGVVPLVDSHRVPVTAIPANEEAGVRRRGAIFRRTDAAMRGSKQWEWILDMGMEMDCKGAVVKIWQLCYVRLGLPCLRLVVAAS